MRPYSVTTNLPGMSKTVQLDVYGWPNISLQVDIIAGTPNFTIDQTLDVPDGTARWYPHPDVKLVNATSGQQGNYAYLPNAIRLTQVGAGTVRLTVLQVGPSPA